MQKFAQIYKILEQSSSPKDRLLVLTDYFRKAAGKDKLWAVALLSGRRPKRLCTAKDLLSWAQEISELPEWLFSTSLKMVDDLTETVALLLPPPIENKEQSLESWMNKIRMLQLRKVVDKKRAIQQAWENLSQDERTILNKIICGNFKLNIAQQLLSAAISMATGTAEHIVAYRLAGKWSAEISDYNELFVEAHTRDYLAKPFRWASEKPVENPAIFKEKTFDWNVCYKWDGLMVQMVLRKGELFLWSDHDKLLNNNFPEIDILRHFLPDGLVIVGQVVAYKKRPLPFHELKPRLGARKPGQKKMLSPPIALMAQDLLEYEGADISHKPLKSRLVLLDEILRDYKSNGVLKMNWKMAFDTKEELDDLRGSLRQAGATGLLFRKKKSPYVDGAILMRPEPLCVKGILVYVELNRRSGRVKTLTLAVRNGGSLQPFGKVQADLPDEDQVELMAFVKENTTGRFGPSKSVAPELVFEVAFDHVYSSRRHKAGLILRMAQLKFWRKDLKPEDADTLLYLQSLI